MWSGEWSRSEANAGVAQLVERKPSKLDVAGSSPVSRSGKNGRRAAVAACVSGPACGVAGAGGGRQGFAHVAQLVEHTLGKGEVIGSIPIACF